MFSSIHRISSEHSPKLQIRSHSYLRAVSEVSINRSLDTLDPKALLASPQYRSRNESYMRAMSTISQVCAHPQTHRHREEGQNPPRLVQQVQLKTMKPTSDSSTDEMNLSHHHDSVQSQIYVSNQLTCSMLHRSWMAFIRQLLIHLRHT